jgi:hypothetical protein
LSKSSHAFKETSVARVIRGVEKTGNRVKAVLVNDKTGEIKVEIGDPETPAAPTTNEWEDWKPNGQSAA